MVKYVEESFEILTQREVIDNALFLIELAGRNCYQSTHKIGLYCVECQVKVENASSSDTWASFGGYTCPKCGKSTLDSTLRTESSGRVFAKRLITLDHESVMEHVNITVEFITCRGMTHELVRHRLAAYSQESTRYCNYSGDQFGNEITVIDQRPHIKSSDARLAWMEAMERAECAYLEMIRLGEPPETARGVLPNDLKTDIVMTANLREWRHVFELRTAKKAHFNIRGLMRELCEQFKKMIPIIFDDITWEED